MHCTCGLDNNYCPIHGEWEEEFEDKFFETGDSENEWIDLLNNNFEDLVRKYKLFNERIKIKVRKGCIQIERMD